jgi:hypothetical protein
LPISLIIQNSSTSKELRLSLYLQSKVTLTTHHTNHFIIMATETTSLPQPQRTVSVDSITLPSSSPAKHVFCNHKAYFSDTPDSLNKLIASRSVLRTRSPLRFDLGTRQQAKSVSFQSLPEDCGRKSVSFSCGDNIDYGYGETPIDDERPAKRRRFERRNSKTPQMLMAMSASLISLEFLSTNDDDDLSKSGSDAGDDCWDGGLEIAEELVKHLQKRRSNCIV